MACRTADAGGGVVIMGSARSPEPRVPSFSARSGPLLAYWHRPGPLHRCPAAVKLGVALGAVLAVVALPRTAWWAMGGAAVVLGGMAAVSRVPLRHLAGRLLLVEAFAVSMALLTLFQENGLQVFLGTLAKSTLCLGVMILLASTTRFSDLLAVLLRVGVPRLLVTTLALTYRYLFLLQDETGRLMRARRSRTFQAGRWGTWRSLATVAAQLFIRTSERAERVHAAMCARGWW